MSILRSLHITLARQGRPVKTAVKYAAAGLIKVLGAARGFKMTPEVSLGNLTMLLGMWEPATVALVKRLLKPGMQVADVGGHVGYFTRLFAAHVGTKGHVFVFEPHPGNFKLLEHNTRHLPQVTRVHAAVGKTPGSAVLFESAVGSGSHSLIESRYPHTRQITSTIVSLDSYFAGHPGLDLIKIDIEGAEHEALEGGRALLSSSHAPSIIIEFYPPVIKGRGLEPSSLLSKLQDYGYTLYAIDDKKGVVPLSAFGGLGAFVAQVDKYVNVLATKRPL